MNGYPTIKVFPSGGKSQEDATDFNGGRTASDIVNWALDQLSENLPAPEVLQLTTEERLKEACSQHQVVSLSVYSCAVCFHYTSFINQVCVIAILPHILDCDSKCRNNFIDILQKQSEKHKKRQWGWVFVFSRLSQGL